MANLNKLTAKQVQTLKADNNKQIRFSDGGGLYLCIRPSGSRYWEFRYTRPVSGKNTFMGIGPYPDISLAKAREKAQEKRRLLLEGIDPQIDKFEKMAQVKLTQAQTLCQVALEWRDFKSSQLKQKTLHDNWRKLEIHAFPKLGNIPLKSIKAPMVIDALRSLESKGKLETVKRTAQLLNEVMNFAVNSGYVEHNPLSGIRDVFKKPIVEHMKALSPDEISDLMRALGHANLYITTRCLIEWQLHTMTRPSEAAGARWDEIDFNTNTWIIPSTRMKMKREHRVPLTIETLSILENIRCLSSNSPFIFPSNRSLSRHIDSESINKALGRIGFKNRTTAHGFRSLASTTLNEWGEDPDLIEVALAHVGRDRIRNAYNRTDYLERRREMMQKWSSYISANSVGSFSVLNVMQDR
ncbi:TPA: tyrosine-type recombinase/integrase [Vibrio parahaemolyticus]|uniref:tyrosine-type recombinase/integrase n=1 Tax=Vibrio parahaemolyticus TaxID=670 RepID=UPI0003FA37D6|nr:tyrosine-type recombinase/integrase [Vibrio parahaemolyticus]HCE2224768.1 tyrosine-type recombinase/integrase [Vibrio parahaemolyticus]